MNKFKGKCTIIYYTRHILHIKIALPLWFGGGDLDLSRSDGDFICTVGEGHITPASTSLFGTALNLSPCDRLLLKFRSCMLLLRWFINGRRSPVGVTGLVEESVDCVEEFDADSLAPTSSF